MGDESMEREGVSRMRGKRGTSISAQMLEKLFERGYVTVKELEETGLANVSSCIGNWRSKGINIKNYGKGSMLNGEIIEKGFYVWDDPKAPKVDATRYIRAAAETAEANEEAAPITTVKSDKWKKLKDRILLDKLFLCDTGNKESMSYKVLAHVEKIMEELDFEEKGGPYK